MRKKPKILITNDDSIHAPGIKYLWRALKEYADLTIVAPKREQSGVGLGITIHSALHIEKFPWEDGTDAWSVSGTPADCIKIASSVLLSNPPDLIVSGINRGTNSGRNVLYSGTIGGVIEGTLRGVPGIAFSSYDIHNTEYAAFTSYVPQIVDFILNNPLPNGTLLNVNFPSMDKVSEQIEVKLTRQGKQYWLEDPLCYHEAISTYSMQAKLVSFVEAEDSDIYWLDHGHISCVPVHVDELTDWRYMQSHKEAFDSKLSTLLKT
jgi:5'-nucleotidase